MAKAQKVNTEKRPFAKRLLSLTHRFHAWEVWSDFIVGFACAISNAVDADHRQAREQMYQNCMSKYTEQERMVFPQLVADVVEALEANPEQDFLGSAYMELELGNHWIGQFFTPYSVCQCMASIGGGNFADAINQRGWVSINDCACGAGATLIAAVHEAGRQLRESGSTKNWQNHVLVAAQDIDLTTGLMCYIQLSLIGAAGYVKIGDSICDPMRAGDDKKNYWYMPMYFSAVWHYRRLWNNIDKLFAKERVD